MPRWRWKCEGAEDAEADGDTVRDGVVGGAFEGVTEGVAEVEEEAFFFVELVDFDEVLFRVAGC